MVILTAAGHGGPDPGALNPYNPSYHEKSVTLKIDSAFSKYATQHGHTVYRMRVDDRDFDLNDIAPKANMVGAHCIIEFHVDSVSDHSASGCHAIAIPGTPGWAVANYTSKTVSTATGIRNLGVKDHFWNNGVPLKVEDVTRFRQLSTRIHLLSENGFISNFQDEQVMESQEGIEKIAWSHLYAIHQYTGLLLPEWHRLDNDYSSGTLIVPVLLGAGMIFMVKK